MIRAIHFSAIALVAAASVIAATSAGSQGQIDAISSMDLFGGDAILGSVESVGAGNSLPAGYVEAERATGFGPKVSGDDTLDGKMSFVASLVADRDTGLPASPNS